jgi:hypothetical protein
MAPRNGPRGEALVGHAAPEVMCRLHCEHPYDRRLAAAAVIAWGVVIACGQNIPNARRLTGRRTQFGGGEETYNFWSAGCTRLGARTRRMEPTAAYILLSTLHVVAAGVKKTHCCVGGVRSYYRPVWMSFRFLKTSFCL